MNVRCVTSVERNCKNSVKFVKNNLSMTSEHCDFINLVWEGFGSEFKTKKQPKSPEPS